MRKQKLDPIYRVERACYSVQIIEELTGRKRAKRIKAMENDKDAMRSYKFRVYPGKTQEKELWHHLWVSKELWNEMLAFTKEIYRHHGKFPTTVSLREFVRNSGLS